MKAKWLMGLIVCAALALYAACGGGQSNVDAEDPTLGDADASPRWESPPPDQGQTPPDREPPIDALEPFDREGSGLD